MNHLEKFGGIFLCKYSLYCQIWGPIIFDRGNLFDQEDPCVIFDLSIQMWSLLGLEIDSKCHQMS